ncbi:MAG: hypothetical protein ACYSSL_09630 [Planctomycetota bacterium]|jgi:hypothetical protein
MIVFNDNSICEQAHAYYYDYLCEERKEYIPAGMLGHINRCQHCQAEVSRLKIVLAEGVSTGQTNSVIITGMRLHFAYIGALVTCKTVRPFLPSLADPALEVGVPTPVTVHLDKCQQCANDLETIRQLNLTHKQLCRLGQLFAEEASVDAVACARTRNVISLVVSMVFRKTSAEILKHLCTCPNCRELIYQRRGMVRRGLLRGKMVQNQFPCEEVSEANIFDYCFPYGIDPAADQYAKFRPAFTSHVSTCPKCLGKMQELHSTVCSILKRQESGIVTHYKVVEDSARDSIVSSPDDAYEGWPIEVEVLDKSKPEPNIIAFPQRLKQRVSTTNLKKFRIPAAAATILIAVGLFFFSTPVARAVDLGQIYKVLEHIKNICVTAFVPGESKPTQEIWISRPLKIKMFKTETEWVLWDMRGKSRKVRDLNTGSIITAELDEDMLMRIEESIEGPVGLLPFDDISEVPEDAQWQQVTDETLETGWRKHSMAP